MAGPLTDRRGVNAVEAVFLNEFGWAFRDQPVVDFGIDAQVEVFEGDKATGKLIALQIKTGVSYFRRQGSDYIYYGDKRHLEYWLGHSLPVLLVLHNPDSGLTLWQRIDRSAVHVADNGWSTVIPAANVLSAASKPAIESIAAGIPTDLPSIRRAQMAMNLDLMKRLLSEEEIYFEIEHWVNKSLGMRNVAIMFGEMGKEPPDLELDWMYPVTTYELLMAYYFPWLDYEHIETNETAAGEIDIIVLEVWVNNLGKGYIAIEHYFADGVPDNEE